MKNKSKKMTTEELKKTVLKGIPKDEIMHKIISGIIECDEKMGVSTKGTLDTITKAMSHGVEREYKDNPYFQLGYKAGKKSDKLFEYNRILTEHPKNGDRNKFIDIIEALEKATTIKVPKINDLSQVDFNNAIAATSLGLSHSVFE